MAKPVARAGTWQGDKEPESQPSRLKSLDLGQTILHACRHMPGMCSHSLGEWWLPLIRGDLWMFDFAWERSLAEV